MNRNGTNGHSTVEFDVPNGEFGTSPYSVDRRGLRIHPSAPSAAPDTTEHGVSFPDLAALTRWQLELIGEDPDREGLQKTPERVSKSLTWLTQGYRQTPQDVVGDAIFAEEHAGMVLVRDVEMYSLCEHHLLPFFGRVHIAYVPDGRVIGLSKLPRIVEIYARRLQVQERLTEQIAAAIEEVLQPKGVRVTIEAAHLCMMMRGVQKQQSTTITSTARGVFLSDATLDAEFQRLVSGTAASF